MTRPILKQYSKTAKQQTTPPSGLAALARRAAARLMLSMSPLPIAGDPGAPVGLSGVSVPEGAVEILGMTPFVPACEAALAATDASLSSSS